MELILLVTCLSVIDGFPSAVNIETSEVNHEENIGQLSTVLSTTASVSAEKTFNSTRISTEIIQAIRVINILRNRNSRTFGTLANFAIGGLLAALDLVEEIIFEENAANNREDVGNFIRLRRQEETTTDPFSTIETATELNVTTSDSPLITIATKSLSADNFNVETTTHLDTSTHKASHLEIFNDNETATRIRLIRQGEDDSKNEIEDSDKQEAADNDEEDDEDDDEGDTGLIGAIISGFLGSLSTPEGAVDVDAVVSVIGSLSAMNEDGTYDFTGLKDTLSAFFGGGDEDGGGSDVGSFAGGLIAAAISGIASPGAKGVGSFVGNLLKQVLPVLSAPNSPDEGGNPDKPQVNAGGFLLGLLNSLFGTPNNSNPGSKPTSPFASIKVNLIKYVFSVISSIIASSSSASKTGKI